MKPLQKMVLPIFMLSLFLSCSKKSENHTAVQNKYIKNTLAYKTVQGVDANRLSLDVYHFGQTAPEKPVVIYVHGGGFAFGDKANQMTNKINLFASLNYILVSVNYRLSPQVYSTDPNRIMYPVHHTDVADAVKWVFENIGNYGGNKEKVALLGHSAGAQLVALSGTSNRFLPTRGINLNLIKGVACIDTEGYDVVARCMENNLIYLNAFGQENTFWHEASPINNLFPNTRYPQFFIAKRGSNTRIGYANEFIAQLQNVGVSVSDITANEYDHEGINDAIGAAGEKVVTEPLKRFFAACFQ